MKNTFKKLIAFIFVIVFSAAAAVTGIAVSAASGSTVTTRTTDKTETDSRSALKSGVWQAIYKTGESKLFFIDNEEHSFSLIDPSMGIGVPSRFDYLPELTMYKLHIGWEGNTENWRMIENNGITAAVSDESGDVISLFYLANDTIDTFEYYTLNELSEMARGFYDARHGSSEGIDFSAAMNADGSFFATVTGMKDGNKVVSYSVDMQTAKGTDDAFETIDLSRFAQ